MAKAFGFMFTAFTWMWYAVTITYGAAVAARLFAGVMNPEDWKPLVFLLIGSFVLGFIRGKVDTDG